MVEGKAGKKTKFYVNDLAIFCLPRMRFQQSTKKNKAIVMVCNIDSKL